jgi:hypothetical protein
MILSHSVSTCKRDVKSGKKYMTNWEVTDESEDDPLENKVKRVYSDGLEVKNDLGDVLESQRLEERAKGDDAIRIAVVCQQAREERDEHRSDHRVHFLV